MLTFESQKFYRAAADALTGTNGEAKFTCSPRQAICDAHSVLMRREIPREQLRDIFETTYGHCSKGV